MVSYWIVYAVNCLLSFIKKDRLKYEKIFFLFSFLLIWLFAGLRYDTGWDYVGYKDSFERLPNMTGFFSGKLEFYNSLYYEKGYKILNIFVKTIFDNYYFLNIVISLLVTILLLNSFKKYTKYYFLAIAIYYGTIYLFTHMSVMRQGIAMSLFIYSIRYIKNRNLKKYSLMILIGSSFHITLLLLYPIYFIPKMKKKQLIILVLILNIIYLFKVRWIGNLNNGLGNLLLPKYVYNKLNYYTQSNLFNSDRGLGIGFIERNAVFIIGIFCKNRSKDEYYETFFKIFIYYLLIYFLFFEISVIFDRLKMYFLVTNAIFYTYFVEIIKNGKFVIIFLLNIYSLISLQTILRYELNKIMFIPYNTIFKNEKEISKSQKGKEREIKALNYRKKIYEDKLR